MSVINPRQAKLSSTLKLQCPVVVRKERLLFMLGCLESALVHQHTLGRLGRRAATTEAVARDGRTTGARLDEEERCASRYGHDAASARLELGEDLGAGRASQDAVWRKTEALLPAVSCASCHRASVGGLLATCNRSHGACA